MLKNDLDIRPVYHRKDAQIEAHIFVSFLSYCLQVTLKRRAKANAKKKGDSAREQRKTG
jgi:transposase